MVNGKFPAEDDSNPAGQEIVADLLYRCLGWAEMVLSRWAYCSRGEQTLDLLMLDKERSIKDLKIPMKNYARFEIS